MQNLRTAGMRSEHLRPLLDGEGDRERERQTLTTPVESDGTCSENNKKKTTGRLTTQTSHRKETWASTATLLRTTRLLKTRHTTAGRLRVGPPSQGSEPFTDLAHESDMGTHQCWSVHVRPRVEEPRVLCASRNSGGNLGRSQGGPNGGIRGIVVGDVIRQLVGS